jgi:hypothetical protein
MSQDKRKWRPSLFGALGEGFVGDATLKDGAHLRWNMDPRLGIPFKMHGRRAGCFTVYSLVNDFDSVTELDLEKASSAVYRIKKDQGSGSSQGRIEYDQGRHYFSRMADSSYLQIFWQYYLKIQFVLANMAKFGPEEQRFIKYMQWIMYRLLPTLASSTPAYVYEDVVAVDLTFQTGAASSSPSQVISIPSTSTSDPLAGPGGISLNPSLASGIGTIVRRPDPTSAATVGTGVSLNTSLFTPKIYAHIKGFDREGHLLDSDWIGRFPARPIVVVGKPPPVPNSPKKIARLRAPGIAYFTVEQVAGQPAVSRKKALWLFCEDYCQADQLWRAASDAVHYFKTDVAENTAQVVRDEYYRPFNKSTDYRSVAEAIASTMLSDIDVLEMLEAHTTYHSYYAAKQCSEQSASSSSQPTTLSLPLLPSLMQAAVDPLMARILGLYSFHESPVQDKRDFKIEAELPFFRQTNLDRCENILKNLGKVSSGQSFFQDTGRTLTATKLCALVVNPTLSRKSAPPKPSPLNNEIHVVDLPSDTIASQTDLVVDSALEVSLNRDEMRPYLRPVCFEIERKTKNTPFENIIQSDQNSPDIGILPPVNIPGPDENEAGQVKLKDFFSIPAIEPELLQYRAKCFDIFGRPSTESLSRGLGIDIPCHPPKSPVNISAHLADKGEKIELHLAFSVFTGQGPLEAVRHSLEILIHRLPSDTSQPPQEVTWPGNKYGGKIKLSFDDKGEELILESVSQECVKLSWSGTNLTRSSVPESDCAASVSDLQPVFEKDTQPLYDPATTGLFSCKAILQLGTKASLGADIHAWCTRLRIHGNCPFGGRDVYSGEPCIGSQINITPPPPEVKQPPLATIPLSTYPDKFGIGYYTLDLSSFLSEAEQSQQPLLNIYATTIDRVGATQANYVAGRTLIDEAGFLTLARTSRLRYERLTREPVTYTQANRYYRVAVPAELEQYHIIGVIGTNPYLEEKPWAGCGIVLFKTPAPLPTASLVFVEGRTSLQGQTSQCNLVFRAEMASASTNQSQPPQIQVLRRDISIGQKSFVFRGYLSGLCSDPSAADPVYQFAFKDDQLMPWHRYVYEVYLLLWDTDREQYLKQTATATCEQIGRPPFGATPLGDAGDFKATANAAGGFTIETAFEAGEFGFSLKKEPYQTTGIEYAGNISRGKLFGLAAGNYDFTVGERYKLAIKDDDLSQGDYTFRLKSGQNQTWTQKIKVTL